MLGMHPVNFELPIAAAEFERRLEKLLAAPTGKMYSDEITFTGRVASGQVRMRARRLSHQALRLRVEGTYEATPDGVAFRGRTLPPREVFLPLFVLVVELFYLLRGGTDSRAQNGWVGLGLFVIVAVVWHLYLMRRLGERVEGVLRELGTQGDISA